MHHTRNRIIDEYSSIDPSMFTGLIGRYDAVRFIETPTDKIKYPRKHTDVPFWCKRK